MGQKRSIRSSVFLVSIASTLIIASCLVVLLFFYQAATFRAELTAKADIIATRLQATLATPLWNFNLAQCEQIIQSELADRDLRRVELTDGLDIAMLSRERASGQNRPRSLLPEGNWAVVSKTLTYRDTYLGTLTLSASGDASLELAARNLGLQGLLIFVAGLIIALTLFVSVDRGVSRRITRLMKEMAGFSDRDLGARAGDRGDDEIGRLASSFNSMAARLERYGRDLESLIAERTMKLQASNEELVAANRSAESSLADLRRTQDQLIEAAKLAEIGRIVSLIIHDLNTPLAAISSTIQLLAGAGLTGLGRMPRLAATLDERGLEAVETLSAGGVSTALDSRTQRARRAALAEKLRAQGSAKAEELSERLVELGLDSLDRDLGTILDSPEGETVLGLAEDLSLTRRSIEVLDKANAGATHVVRSLRAYIHRERDEEGTARVDLTREIEGTLTLLSFRKKSGIEIITRLQSGCSVMGRRDQLAQVWMNLIDNALHSMGAAGRLEISARTERGQAVIGILDDGPGIPLEIRDRLFEPFFTTKGRGEGTGLGLGISKRIVEEHGGTLGFESEPGSTLFWVRLPVGEEPT